MGFRDSDTIIEPIDDGGAFDSGEGSTSSTSESAANALQAANSAAAALVSENNAETSETGAATSASTATTKASEASASASGAATSATNAADTVTTVEAAKVAAETAETNAETAETNAASSASTATSQAAIATTKAQLATDKSVSATQSASVASTHATSATSSASTATTKASEASTSATNAATSASNASTSASTATTKASEASTSATSASGSASTATTKASEASTSATNAATSATAAQTAETNAETAETNAEASESSASGSASTATTKASEASTSATNAATSATSASTSASTATTKASEASASATSASSSASTATTKAGEAATSATSASGSASTATTKASEAATSATSASGSATTATTRASEASTSETNAATSASTASSQASTATTKASEASASATSAATSASTATTKASEASASATSAATSASNSASSATAAQTAETNAETAETNAAASATTATTKAGESLASANSSASSATTAEAAKDAALAALDSFDDRYLGAKSSAPTVDNDGNALVSGALYFNTTDDAMNVYTGSAWVAAYASLSGALLATSNLSDLDNAVSARSNLGLVIGTNVQAFSAILAATTASYTTALNTKLSGIETGATADQTGAEIKTAYQAEANAFTDSLYTKLDNIEASADVTDTANVVSSLTAGSNITIAADGTISGSAAYSLPTSSATVLGGVKVGTNLSISGTGVLSSANTTYTVGDGGLTQRNFTTTLKDKLDGVAAGATNYTDADAIAAFTAGTNISIAANGTISAADSTKLPLTGGTMTGELTINNSNGVSRLHINGTTPTINLDDSDGDSFNIHINSNAFYVLADRDGGGGYGAWESPHPLKLDASTNIGYVFEQRIFNEAYHPNADKWTTARTLTLAGDATGSVSWDGSANATLTMQVADDSHLHDSRYIQEGGTNYNGTYPLYARTGPREAYSHAGITFTGSSNTLTINGGTAWHSNNDGSGSGLDADLLDGVHGSSFLRSDAEDTGVSLNLAGGTNNGANDATLYVTASNNNDWGIKIGADSGKTEYGQVIKMPSAFNHAFRVLKNGTEHFNINSTGATVGGNYIWHAGNDGSGSGLDADTVDGIQAASFLRSDADDSFSGGLVSLSRDEGIFGTYDSTKTDHIWSMGTAYKNHASGTNFGNLYGLAYKHTNNATGGNMASGHQVVWCTNGTPRVALGSNIWTSGSILVTGTVDGRDVATDGTKLDTIATNANNYSFPYTVSASASNSTVVQRHSSGYIFANYFNTTANDVSSGVTKVMVETGNDNYIRHGSAGAIRSFINVADGANNYSLPASPSFTHLFINDYVHHSGDTNTYMGFDNADNWRVATNGTTRMQVDNSNTTMYNNIQMSGHWLDMNNNAIYGVDTIYHEGDTNTYMQFHASDQWRVVTGGTERLEVNNSAITSTLPFFATYLSTNDYLYHTGDTDTKIGFPGSDTIFGYVSGSQGFSQTTSAFSSYQELRGYGNIIAYYSDERLKTRVGDIENAVEKVKTLDAFYYVENDLAKTFGYDSDKKQVALSAQDVQKVLPEAVTLAPFDMEDDHETGETYSKSGENYLTVDYARMVPLLIEAIKEQQQQIDDLKVELSELRGK